MGMTIAEKILAKASGKEEVKPGEYVTAKVDAMMSGDGSAGLYRYMKEIGIEEVWDPERIVVLTDHRVPSPNEASGSSDVKKREFVKKYGIKYWYEVGRGGICHQVFSEKGHALPGELITGQDSHTTTYGAFNAASTGVQAPGAILVAAKGETWFRVPETIRFRIDGKLPEMIMGKDLVLKIAGDYGTDVALYRSIEFIGTVVEDLSIAGRMTMANMGVDIGAKFAIFEADQKVLEYLRPRAKRRFVPVKSDQDAVYEETYDLDVADLDPLVACPHDISNVKPVSEVEKERVKVNQAFIGSCTNGRFEDLEMAAKILKGNKVHPDVRMIVIPASVEVYREALHAGLLNVFVDSEAFICGPTCGPCNGAHAGIMGSGERCIASSNRNFKGRMGPPDSEIYLASPATVAASAIKGYISDPRKII